ncbi:Alpha/Beta hydrolase protein [Aspergillus cavernicola]|uniref:Alpha/Beta hydrolase protein n=1 Tax=Aspergillus cavernicola TaxID=176166 RepID=A0ABR4HWI7_9EURO
MLTIAQKLDYIPALASVAVTFVWAVLTVAWRAPQYPSHWLLHIGYAVFRKLTARLSVAQMQYVLPASNLVYNRYIRSVRQKPLTVNLDHGAMGHWIGNPNAKNILVWYHGGGFALPANIGYFKFFANIIAECERNGQSLAVFALTYTLAPVATYPTQLRQAVEALRYILVEKRHPATNVILGGDSAGGSLVGGVLSHLAHPHPAINPIDLDDVRLAGAVMIAPWTLMNPNLAERVLDPRGDLITPAVGQIWSAGYVGKAPSDFYTDLNNAPTDWYATFPVRKILVCGGEREILLPVIEDLVQRLRAGFKGEEVEFCVGKGEGHVAPVYNLYLGDKRETQQGQRAKLFIRGLLEQ